jgi:hypothetical protein
MKSGIQQVSKADDGLIFKNYVRLSGPGTKNEKIEEISTDTL